MKAKAGFFFLCLLLIPPVFADLPGKAPTTINKQNTNPFQKAPPQKEQPLRGPRMPRPKMGTKDVGTPFTLPGIVGISQGQWAGSDNLFNLKPEIGIYVELVMPEDQKFDINERNVKAKVQEIFSKAGINSVVMHESGEPPLPLYHVLIMLNSFDQCLVASCACRLFEPVTLKRVVLEEGITFQAITWEKQNLITATKRDFYQLLEKTLEEITSTFAERVEYFQNIRNQR